MSGFLTVLYEVAKSVQFLEGDCTRGGIPLYKLYRYVPPHRVGFLCRFGLKTGINFAHFGLESGMVLRGNCGSVRTSLSFEFQMSKKERKICQLIRNGFEQFFVCALILVLVT